MKRAGLQPRSATVDKTWASGLCLLICKMKLDEMTPRALAADILGFALVIECWTLVFCLEKWLSRGKWLDPAFLWYTWAFPRGMCYQLALPLRKVIGVFLGPGDSQLPFCRKG